MSGAILTLYVDALKKMRMENECVDMAILKKAVVFRCRHCIPEAELPAEPDENAKKEVEEEAPKLGMKGLSFLGKMKKNVTATRDKNEEKRLENLREKKEKNDADVRQAHRELTLE